MRKPDYRSINTLLLFAVATGKMDLSEVRRRVWRAQLPKAKAFLKGASK